MSYCYSCWRPTYTQGYYGYQGYQGEHPWYGQAWGWGWDRGGDYQPWGAYGHYDRSPYYGHHYDRSFDRYYDRGYDKSPYYGHQYDKSPYYGQYYDKSYDRYYDRGYDKSYDKSYDRSYERNPGWFSASSSWNGPWTKENWYSYGKPAQRW